MTMSGLSRRCMIFCTNFLNLPKFQIFFLTDLIKYNAMLSIGVIIACLGSLGAVLPSEDTFVSTNTKQGQ